MWQDEEDNNPYGSYNPQAASPDNNAPDLTSSCMNEKLPLLFPLTNM